MMWHKHKWKLINWDRGAVSVHRMILYPEQTPGLEKGVLLTFVCEKCKKTKSRIVRGNISDDIIMTTWPVTDALEGRK